MRWLEWCVQRGRSDTGAHSLEYQRADSPPYSCGESDRECVRQVHNFNRNWPYQFAWCSPARVKGSHSWTKWWPCSVHWPACVPESCILAVLPVCKYWLILLLALLPSLSPPPPHTPMGLYYMQVSACTTCPSLINRTVSVDIKRRVYLLTRLEEEDLEKQI